MATAKTPDPMAAAAAGRVAEFARACKAAIRTVSMYPPSHPTIQSALARMVAAGTAATEGGPMVLTVTPETLLVAGQSMPRPETAVDELASLLHEHKVGELTLQAPLTAGAWHMLLSLLATSPEDVRNEGGLASAWQAVGGGPLEIREIDYGEILRERDPALSRADPAWEDLITRCLVGGDASGLDEGTLASLLEIARDADRLGEFLVRLQERFRTQGTSIEAQQESVTRLLRALVEFAAAFAPDEFDEVMNNVASGTARLTPDLMLSLLGVAAESAEADGRVESGVNLGGELRARFTEERLAAFVAENVARDRGATGRLAEAFNALVTSEAQRSTALLLAEERVSLSDLGSDPQFNEIWSHAVKMLMSYTDTDYVPAEYDRELTTARAMAVEIEQITDDPPDRIAAWISTVADRDLRALDQQMLVDLLRLEDRPEAWASVLELAEARLEQLVLVSDLRLAGEIATALAGVAADPNAPFAAEARQGIARATGGPLAGHLMTVMRQMADEDVPMLHALCLALGTGIVPPLVAAIGPGDRLAVRRLKDVLIGFGAAAYEPARTLRGSSHPAVRRAAIEVLEAVSGDGALADLEAMLEDADPHVQRESVRAIVRIGSAAGYGVLEKVFTGGEARAREAIIQTLGTISDERAAPLLVLILEHTAPRGPGEATYVATLEALGRSGSDPRGIGALKDALYRGEWWAPFRTARLRAAAARALHGTASPAGDAVLEDASTNGPRGVRKAAGEAMSAARRSRPAGGTP